MPPKIGFRPGIRRPLLLSSPLIDAIKKEVPLISEISPLISDVMVQKVDHHKSTPLMIAIQKGHSDVFFILLRFIHGKNYNKDQEFINKKNRDSKTALLLAAELGHFLIVKALVEAGASLDDKDDEGKTALMHAVETEHSDIVEALLEAGASHDEKDNEGKTALMHAVESGRSDIVKALANAGANFNEKDNTGMTALMIASSKGNIEIVTYLIGSGASFDEKDNTGMTALMFAKKSKNSEVVGLLSYKVMKAAIKAKNYRLLRELLYECNEGVNYITPIRKTTLLHYAVAQKDITAVSSLLSSGAKINISNRDKNTALHLAIELGLNDIAMMLIRSDDEKNKTFEMVNKSSMTALELALEKECYELIALMTLKYEALELKVRTAIKSEILKFRDIIINRRSKYGKASTILDATNFVGGEYPRGLSLVNEMYSNMYEMDDLSDILDLISLAALGLHSGNRLHIILDHEKNCTENMTKGWITNALGAYIVNGHIYIGAREMEDQFRGTLIHELTHCAAYEIYKNDSKPYFADDHETIERFTKICNDLKARIEPVDSSDLPETIINVFKYPKEDWHAELIVRIPEMIAEKGMAVVEELKETCPELLLFYREVFLVDCRFRVEEIKGIKGINNPKIIHGPLAVRGRPVHAIRDASGYPSSDIRAATTHIFGLGLAAMRVNGGAGASPREGERHHTTDDRIPRSP